MPTFQTPNRWRRYNATPGAHQRWQRAREAASIAGPAPAYPPTAPLHGDWLGGCINGQTVIVRLMRDPFVKERWYVDGPRYLLSTGSSVFIGQYGYTGRGKGRWQDHYERICQPTHWMPLPAAPTAQQEPKP